MPSDKLVLRRSSTTTVPGFLGAIPWPWATRQAVGENHHEGMVFGYTTACFYYELNGSILHILSVAKTCFFLATVMSGRRHVDGILEWGPWEAPRLH